MSFYKYSIAKHLLSIFFFLSLILFSGFVTLEILKKLTVESDLIWYLVFGIFFLLFYSQRKKILRFSSKYCKYSIEDGACIIYTYANKKQDKEYKVDYAQMSSFRISSQPDYANTDGKTTWVNLTLFFKNKKFKTFNFIEGSLNKNEENQEIDFLNDFITSIKKYNSKNQFDEKITFRKNFFESKIWNTFLIFIGVEICFALILHIFIFKDSYYWSFILGVVLFISLLLQRFLETQKYNEIKALFEKE